MNAQVAVAVLIGLVASIDDLARRRVANWIPLAALAAGLLFNTMVSGWRGAVSSLLGAAAGFAVFLVFYALGGLGGGDVKLMAGFGALVGIDHLLAAALWVAGCGALLACGALAGQWLWNHSFGRRGRPSPSLQAIPYAPAIAVGVWISLLAA